MDNIFGDWLAHVSEVELLQVERSFPFIRQRPLDIVVHEEQSREVAESTQPRWQVTSQLIVLQLKRLQGCQ